MANRLNGYDSDTCRMCHLTTFQEWEESRHAARNVECFDCHMPHDQGLRTGSAATMCSTCHPERQREFAHATHGISGLDCAGCHMSTQETPTAFGVQIEVRNHDFRVAADTCARCPLSAIHVSTLLSPASETADEQSGGPPREKADLVLALTRQVDDLRKQLDAQRSLSLLVAGLALGLGAFLGAIVGVIGATLWRK